MKEGICNIIWVICCAVMLLSGCDSFLDVQPKGIVEQKKQFEDIPGISGCHVWYLCFYG